MQEPIIEQNPSKNDIEAQAKEHERPFFTAEIESLIESFAHDKKNIVCLPRAEMVDGNNKLFPQDIFEKKLSDIVNGALKKGGNKNLLLLDCGSLTKPETNVTEKNFYNNTTIVASIGESRDYCELALLCFSKDDAGDVTYFYTGPKNLIEPSWLEMAFLKDFPGRRIHGNILDTSENKLHASVQICHQAGEYIEKGSFAEDLTTQGKDITTFVTKYETELSNTFYHTRPMGETVKSNLTYFAAMLAGYLIFAGSRYAETWMIMSQDESLLETSTLPVAVMRVMVLMSVRPLESITMLGATAFGAKRYSELGSLLRAGWAASLLLDAITIPILCTSEFWLQSVFKQDAALAKAGGDYLKRYAWAIPPVTASVADHNIFFATNNPGVVTLIELISVLIGVGLTYTFVFGKLGFEPQGLTGFATSLVIQKWLIFGMAKAYLYLTRDSRKYTVLAKSSFSEIVDKLKLIFRNGLPLTFQIGSEQLYMFIVAIYAGLYGRMHNNKSLDQANILNEYFTLFSISAGLVIHKTLIQRVGEVRGRDLMLRDKKASLELIQQNLRNIPQILKVNGAVSLIYTAAVSATFMLGCQSLVSVYVDSSDFNAHDQQDIRNNIFILFAILSACTLTEMLGNTMNGALNGLGDVDSPMLRSLLLTVVVGAALGALLCFGANMGLEGVYSSSLIAYTIGVFALSQTFYSMFKYLNENTADINNSVLGSAWEKVTSCFVGKTNEERCVELLDGEELENTISAVGRKTDSCINRGWSSASRYCGSFFGGSGKKAPEFKQLLIEVDGEKQAAEEDDYNLRGLQGSY